MAEKKQEEIFREMPIDKKVKLVSDLTMPCLELNRLNKNHKPQKIYSNERNN